MYNLKKIYALLFFVRVFINLNYFIHQRDVKRLLHIFALKSLKEILSRKKFAHKNKIILLSISPKTSKEIEIDY